MASDRTYTTWGARECTWLYNIDAIFNRRKSLLLRQLSLPGETGLGVVVVATVLLMCAVVASLGVGVLVAYGTCLGMFRVLRVHATQVAAKKVVAVGLRVAL